MRVKDGGNLDLEKPLGHSVLAYLSKQHIDILLFGLCGRCFWRALHVCQMGSLENQRYCQEVS